MSLHVIVGAGAIGSATAIHLADAGHQVLVLTRRGTGPVHPSVERAAGDATDADHLAELAAGAAAIYNCANPPAYHTWPRDWPPLANAILQACERTGAVLVTMSNLYGYGPVDGPLTPDLPLRATTVKGRIRADMWREALAAHRAGRIRATEARASDFVGAGAKSIFGDMIAPTVRSGRRVHAPVDFDVPHSHTYTGDAGRTLAAIGTDARAWGRAWHVPTPPPTTLRDLAQRYAQIVGAPPPRLRSVSTAALRAAALVNPTVRAFVEMRYQFIRPFVLDSALTEQTFGLMPTELDEAVRTT